MWHKSLCIVQLSVSDNSKKIVALYFNLRISCEGMHIPHISIRDGIDPRSHSPMTKYNTRYIDISTYWAIINYKPDSIPDSIEWDLGSQIPDQIDHRPQIDSNSNFQIQIDMKYIRWDHVAHSFLERINTDQQQQMLVVVGTSTT